MADLGERPTYEGNIDLSQIDAPEEFWGERHEEVIEWLRAHYDPSTMPRLQVATIKGGIRRPGRKKYTLLGWQNEDTYWPPLLSQVFGEAYAAHRIEQVRADIMMKEPLTDPNVDQDGSHRGA